jgi:outer membrane protein OmpA-like peptidoglycan-associated protein
LKDAQRNHGRKIEPDRAPPQPRIRPLLQRIEEIGMPRPSACSRLVTTTTAATTATTATTATATFSARWSRWGLDVLAFMLLAVASSVAWPQATVHAPEGSTLHYREGQRIDPQQVRQILSTDAPARGRTRSIRLLDGDAGTTVPAPEESTPPSALSAPIQFEFDSTAILPEARGQLDAIAEGIKLLPPGRQVVIEGHTDAVGSDDYNQQLSRRRAAAVKQYLAQRHGIAPQRLREMGLGERQPIDGLDPFAPDNRRVQFRGG